MENRLLSATVPGTGGGGANTVSFKYDPFGRRIQKSSASGTTYYLYDGANIVAEVSASGGIGGVDEPLAMRRGGYVNYYHADGLGSVTSLTNTGGSLVATYAYDSFGNTTPTEGIFNPFRYTGREQDPETGLYYYRARYYDPAIISEDPIRFRGGMDFYLYTRNNPTRFIDPTGRISIAPGFRPNCLADILNALQLLKNRPPACDCWFNSHGLRLSLEQLLASPAFTLHYQPQSDYGEGGATLAYVQPYDPVNNIPADPFGIYITPEGCASGPTHIAQDIVHELAHLTLGQLSGALSAREHNKVRKVEILCGFTLQMTNSTSITVTAK